MYRKQTVCVIEGVHDSPSHTVFSNLDFLADMVECERVASAADLDPKNISESTVVLFNFNRSAIGPPDNSTKQRKSCSSYILSVVISTP